MFTPPAEAHQVIDQQLTQLQTLESDHVQLKTQAKKAGHEKARALNDKDTSEKLFAQYREQAENQGKKLQTAHQETIEALQKQCRQLTENHQQMVSDLKQSHENQRAEWMQRWDQAKTQNQTLEKVKNALNDQLQQLKIKLSEREMTYQAQTATLQQLKARESENDKILKALHQTHGKLTAEKTALQNQCQKAQDKVEQCHLQDTQAQILIAQLQAEHQALKKRLTKNKKIQVE